METEGGENSERNIHGRPGGSDQDHVASRVAEGSKIDRHRLGITEQERHAQQQQEARQQDRSKWVDVLEGIEADASKPPCRFVAKEMGDEAMCRFMKRNRDDYRDNSDRRQIDPVRQFTHSIGKSD
jgi:hypothetical protein